MKFAIIISQQDIAGLNIKARLLEKFNFNEQGVFHNSPIYGYSDNISLFTVEKELIFSEHLDREIGADLFIFASKHKAESGLHCLTVHTQGNWAKAEFGGYDRKLCIAPALYLRKALLRLKRSETDYEITQECTHHGPYLDKPSMFIEIGSTEQEWQDIEAGTIIAETIMYLLLSDIDRATVGFGIGGPHYMPNFTKLIERRNIAIGHTCPKYMLQCLDKEMILQAMQKTYDYVDEVILDWKGLGTEKKRIIALLEEMNIDYKRIDLLLKTEHVEKMFKETSKKIKPE